MVLLLNGNIKQSFFVYPPLIPSLFLIIIFALYLLNRKIINRKFLMYYSSFVLAIIAINYFIKLII
ncbi:MAG: hypothetical protein ACOXZH_00270 [Bacteroidales bacterium]